MFLGNFKDNLSSIQIEEKHGAVSNNERDHFFKDTELEIMFFGVLYNQIIDIKNPAELIATIYNKNGTADFKKLDGSFTFIIKHGNTTIVARDHHGTNSLVYYNSTHYSSSLSKLLKSQNCDRNVNKKALASFLATGYIPTGQSSFENIHKLDAGSILICNGIDIHTENLFDTSHILPSTKEIDLETASDRYAFLHRQSIQKRIGESRNIGILLSGGYDSGCNLAALRGIYNGDIHSYSIGFKGDNWSELPLAKCMSDTFGTIHNQYEIDGSEILALPDIIKHLGDPFVEGGLMVNYAAMRMIGSAKPDIILGGDGSDQYFGTSAREVAIHYLASKYGVKPLLTAIHKLLSNSSFDKNNNQYRIKFHLSKILNILNGDVFGFEPSNLSKLLNDSTIKPYSNINKADCRSFEHLYTQHAYKSDLEIIINQVILHKASRMADMFKNNIAFPYMDLELYNFLKELPVNLKCKGENAFKIAKGECTAKFLLKYHYKPQLPELITCKKKQGGFAPMPIFFKDKAQRSRIADYIMQSSVTDEFLNRRYVEQFIKTYDNEADNKGKWFWYKQNCAIKYFSLLNIAIWWEQHVKLNESTSL